MNYPRLNEFPEWFTVEDAGRYTVAGLRESRQVRGVELARGIQAALQAGQTITLTITP